MNYLYSALVTDGLWRKSLSVIRSLGRAGYHITVMGDSVFTVGFWSKYTKRMIQAPTAAFDKVNFGSRLLCELEMKKHKFSSVVLFPMEDASVMWVADHIADVRQFANVLLPSLDSLNIAQSKIETLNLAKEIGIPCPQTRDAEKCEDLIDLIKEWKDENFIVKPIRGTGSSGIVYNDSKSFEFWQEHYGKYGKLLVQERIPKEGEGIGVCLLMDRESECVASFSHKRLREYPVSGGPSTDRVSIYAPELVELSIKFLKRLSWQGVAMVEWKMDPRDGIAKLMEINPRFWGSLELAIRAGVDFPVLYAKIARGEKVKPVHVYTEGVRCRWIQGDIMRYISQPKVKREKISEFLKGFFSLSEEWNKEDICGWAATWICILGLAADPKYWKYLKR